MATVTACLNSSSESGDTRAEPSCNERNVLGKLCVVEANFIHVNSSSDGRFRHTLASTIFSLDRTYAPHTNLRNLRNIGSDVSEKLPRSTVS